MKSLFFSSLRGAAKVTHALPTKASRGQYRELYANEARAVESQEEDEDGKRTTRGSRLRPCERKPSQQDESRRFCAPAGGAADLLRLRPETGGEQSPQEPEALPGGQRRPGASERRHDRRSALPSHHDAHRAGCGLRGVRAAEGGQPPEESVTPPPRRVECNDEDENAPCSCRVHGISIYFPARSIKLVMTKLPPPSCPLGTHAWPQSRMKYNFEPPL